MLNGQKLLSKKGQGAMEKHDHLCPEKKRVIKEEFSIHQPHSFISLSGHF